MKNIVGKATIVQNTIQYGLRIYLSSEFKRLIGSSIVFNNKTMTITRPTIDSKVTYSIKGSDFPFLPRDRELDGYAGKYWIVQKDEDTFKLKKIKPNGALN